jgi:Tfp pilus assembly protein PilO
MTRIQQWIAGTVVAVIAIAGAGWFVAIAPQSHKASNLVAQAATQEQDNVVLRGNLARLNAQRSKVAAEQLEIGAIAQKIPTDPGLPSYVRNLTAAAAKTGVEIVSIAPGVPATVVIPAAVVAPAATASAAAAPSTPAAAAPVAAPAATLQAISIGVVVQGGYYQLEEFTKALEGLNRSTVLTAVSILPAASIKAAALAGGSTSATAWKSLQASITLSVFMNSNATITPVVVPTTAPAGAVSSPGAPTSVTTVTPPAVPSASASH